MLHAQLAIEVVVALQLHPHLGQHLAGAGAGQAGRQLQGQAGHAEVQHAQLQRHIGVIGMLQQHAWCAQGLDAEGLAALKAVELLGPGGTQGVHGRTLHQHQGTQLELQPDLVQIGHGHDLGAVDQGLQLTRMTLRLQIQGVALGVQIPQAGAIAEALGRAELQRHLLAQQLAQPGLDLGVGVNAEIVGALLGGFLWAHL